MSYLSQLFQKQETDAGNQLLAQLLTNAGVDPSAVTADDLVKHASLEVLQEVAGANEIDLDSLTAEEVEELYNELYSEAPEGAEGDPEDIEKTAAAQLAEHDYLGRHMARAFMDELQKEAGFKPSAFRRAAVALGAKKKMTELPYFGAKAIGAFAGAAKDKAKKLGGKAGAFASKKGKAFAAFASKKGKAGEKWVKKNPKKGLGVAAAIGGAAGAGGGYAAGKEKSASALDIMATHRAASILDFLGVNPATGAEYAEGEKTANIEPVTSTSPTLEEAVNSRALDLLEEQGWDTDKIVEALSQE